jgi:cyclic-di-GMP-binding protein
MPSFDVVSKLDRHEVENAVNQASKEVGQRYDFRDTGTSIEQTEDGIVLRSNAEARLEAALGVLEEKMVKRKVSLKSLDPEEP